MRIVQYDTHTFHPQEAASDGLFSWALLRPHRWPTSIQAEFRPAGVHRYGWSCSRVSRKAGHGLLRRLGRRHSSAEGRCSSLGAAACERGSSEVEQVAQVTERGGPSRSSRRCEPALVPLPQRARAERRPRLWGWSRLACLTVAWRPWGCRSFRTPGCRGVWVADIGLARPAAATCHPRLLSRALSKCLEALSTPSIRCRLRHPERRLQLPALLPG